METLLSQNEAAALARISGRELRNRMTRGEYQWRRLPSARLKGVTTKAVVLESMPAEVQLRYIRDSDLGIRDSGRAKALDFYEPRTPNP